MYKVHDTLASCKHFIDNEYLEKYCQLIEHNRRTKLIPKHTHKHHILPKSWFKLNNQEINNFLNNLVNLSCTDHFLAHYYLCLCTEDPFRYANELALICLESKKFVSESELLMLHNLPMYNTIYEDYQSKVNTKYKLYENKVTR